MKALPREYIGGLNPDLEGGTYTGYTPFIDSLLKVSLTFDVSIANGKKSIDAMPSILASVHHLKLLILFHIMQIIRLMVFLNCLKRKGYYSAFFHGAPNGSMGFDSFAKVAGFDDYFGLDQYP